MNMVKRLRDLATSLISRASGKEVADTANTDRPTVLITTKGESVVARRVQPYGMASRPPDSAEVIALSINGDRQQTLAIIQDDGNRPNLNPGDTCIFAGDNQIIIRAGGDIEITAPNTRARGNVLIEGNLLIGGGIAAIGGGAVEVQGDLNSTGNIKTSTGDITAGTISLKTHRHRRWASGPETEPPTA